jgi:hypothetical protein
MSKVTKTYDNDLELKDAGAITASAAAQISSEDQIIDLGAGVLHGDIVIDVTACEVASGNEMYTVGAQISDSATFASGIYEVTCIKLGSSRSITGDTDMGIGRYILPFRNTIANNVSKRYMRLYTTISGSISTGINYSAYLAKK